MSLILQIIVPLIVAIVVSPTLTILVTKRLMNDTPSPLLALSKHLVLFKTELLTTKVINLNKDSYQHMYTLMFTIFSTQPDLMDDSEFVLLRERLLNVLRQLNIHFEDITAKTALKEFGKRAAAEFKPCDYTVVINLIISVCQSIVQAVELTKIDGSVISSVED